MDWTREQTQAGISNWWFRLFAMKDGIKWQLAGIRTPGSNSSPPFYLVSAQGWTGTWILLFISRFSNLYLSVSHFLLLNLYPFPCSSTQIDAHAPYFSCLFQVRAWSATAPVIRVLSPYQRSRCIIGAGARLCLSVSARHARFITWRCSIFASHVSIFVVSLGREWAGRCYFVQWAVILGPWHQIPFL